MNVGTLLDYLTVFVLAILLGFEVISKVPATLHTPLMSGTNSIHGIVLVGAIMGRSPHGPEVKDGTLQSKALGEAHEGLLPSLGETPAPEPGKSKRPKPALEQMLARHLRHGRWIRMHFAHPDRSPQRSQHLISQIQADGRQTRGCNSARQGRGFDTRNDPGCSPQPSVRQTLFMTAGNQVKGPGPVQS